MNDLVIVFLLFIVLILVFGISLNYGSHEREWHYQAFCKNCDKELSSTCIDLCPHCGSQAGFGLGSTITYTRVRRWVPKNLVSGCYEYKEDE